MRTSGATERMYPDPVYREKMYHLRNQAVRESLPLGIPAKPNKIRARVMDATVVLLRDYRDWKLLYGLDGGGFPI